MGKKKLSQIKAEVAALLRTLPGESPEAWLAPEIETAKKDPSRDAQTLEMLCAALEGGGEETAESEAWPAPGEAVIAPHSARVENGKLTAKCA